MRLLASLVLGLIVLTRAEEQTAPPVVSVLKVTLHLRVAGTSSFILDSMDTHGAPTDIGSALPRLINSQKVAPHVHENKNGAAGSMTQHSALTTHTFTLETLSPQGIRLSARFVPLREGVRQQERDGLFEKSFRIDLFNSGGGTAENQNRGVINCTAVAERPDLLATGCHTISEGPRAPFAEVVIMVSGT